MKFLVIGSSLVLLGAIFWFLSKAKHTEEPVEPINQTGLSQAALDKLESDIKIAIGEEVCRSCKIDFHDLKSEFVCEIHVEKKYFGQLYADAELQKKIEEMIMRRTNKRAVWEIIEL